MDVGELFLRKCGLNEDANEAYAEPVGENWFYLVIEDGANGFGSAYSWVFRVAEKCRAFDFRGTQKSRGRSGFSRKASLTSWIRQGIVIEYTGKEKDFSARDGEIRFMGLMGNY